MRIIKPTRWLLDKLFEIGFVWPSPNIGFVVQNANKKLAYYRDSTLNFHPSANPKYSSLPYVRKGTNKFFNTIFEVHMSPGSPYDITLDEKNPIHWQTAIVTYEMYLAESIYRETGEHPVHCESGVYLGLDLTRPQITLLSHLMEKGFRWPNSSYNVAYIARNRFDSEISYYRELPISPDPEHTGQRRPDSFSNQGRVFDLEPFNVSLPADPFWFCGIISRDMYTKALGTLSSIGIKLPVAKDSDEEEKPVIKTITFNSLKANPLHYNGKMLAFTPDNEIDLLKKYGGNHFIFRGLTLNNDMIMENIASNKLELESEASLKGASFQEVISQPIIIPDVLWKVLDKSIINVAINSKDELVLGRTEMRFDYTTNSWTAKDNNKVLAVTSIPLASFNRVLTGNAFNYLNNPDLCISVEGVIPSLSLCQRPR